MLSEAQFPFLAEKGHVVSLVGGGGKTTLLYQLSVHWRPQGLAGAGRDHDPHPAAGPQHGPYRSRMQRSLGCGEYAVLGTPDGCGKLTAPPPDLLHRWMPQADAVFLEADGAKRHALQGSGVAGTGAAAGM